ncbi:MULTISPECIES: formylmethanofuran dehydrogenase [unclassified Caballeronia]|uniref:formylmethanofuran dehydrogenase n=1 Tax=unclassified Caballeronia TaxID=2646786 RepID=UPI00285A910F|nr:MULTISPECIES: formylmethanofuran dehydrogenase [unclassified Caballeronia]MDR5754386.1 formylmethanofuran dehydrogenase [Caballeronia sp. LZ024]MDR5840764.1 formylmethanofuran dehydrogenase [Caballeronia sp. LZ031]
MHEPSPPTSSAGQPGAAVAPAPSPSSSPAQSDPVTRAAKGDWTCPFCPLLCDDISLDLHGDDSLAASNTDCPRLARSIARFGAADAACTPTIDGASTDLASALARAGEILSRAGRPLFGGLATDVAGARALYELAAREGAVLDHLHGDALAASTLALQDRGAFFTTLSEVRSRADLMVVFACEPARRYPRFYERALGGVERDVAACFVACSVDPAAAALPHVSTDSILADADPFDLLAQWSALIEGRGIAERDVSALADRVAAARYTVFVYEPAALPQPHAALLIEALNRIVKAVNRTTRAGGLALGGDDGALTVNQAMTWLSGFPLRTHVSMTAPLDYDPYRYRTETLLADGEADALLWIASFGPQPLPASLADDVPAIVLGHPALAGMLGKRSAPTVFIPVATPGIDSGGHLFRIDATVVAPLQPARRAALPTVAAIAQQLAQRSRP